MMKLLLLSLLATVATAFVAVPLAQSPPTANIGSHLTSNVLNAGNAIATASRANAYTLKMAGASDNWKDYKFTELPYKRKKGYQSIKYNKSRTGRTEFLIVSKSNGNGSTDTKRAATIKGGGWGDGRAPVYAGNDDRCVEIWSRQVKTNADTKDLGKIDIKNGQGAMAIVAYKKGYINIGKTNDETVKKAARIEIDNKGKAPWLVSAVADNGKNLDYSKIADETFGPKKDDPCFLYITTDKNFEDKTCGKIRGAISSIELKD